MMEADTFVTVQTRLPKLPFPSNDSRQPTRTQRLLIRPLTPDDAQSLHALRTEEVVMRWTSARRVDADLAETQAKLALYLAPHDADTFQFAICAADTGELIGCGGCHRFVCSFGWPEIGYMLREAHWGRGFGTEFMCAFLALWTALPRTETTIRVDPRTVAAAVGTGSGTGTGVEAAVGPPLVDEQLIAMTEEGNVPSQNILRKCGFEYLLTWDQNDITVRGAEKRAIPTFRLFPNAMASSRNM